MLTEKKIHAILQSGIKTLSFSADAADEKITQIKSKWRLNKILKIFNYLIKFEIKLFFFKYYYKSFRGVNEQQNIDDMQNFGEILLIKSLL